MLIEAMGRIVDPAFHVEPGAASRQLGRLVEVLRLECLNPGDDLPWKPEGVSMRNNLIAKASVSIGASAANVWDALVNPNVIKQYMFGTTVVSDWREGSPITWKGEWKGKPYEDKGTIRKIEPRRLLQYSHYSPLSGLPDTAANHHTVTIELSESGAQTRVSLSQDNNASEEAREDSEKNWKMMLEGLKKLLEK